MANALGRVIEEGEVVVLRKNSLKKEYRALEHRLVRCNGGFGMKPFLRGHAISVEFLSDGEVARCEGYEIDQAETERWQEEYGARGERWPETETQTVEEG